MTVENRRYSRFNPKGLKAQITLLDKATNHEIRLDGEVADMSYSGIRIKLDSVLPNNLPDSHIKIEVTMPVSGNKVLIKGEIRHTSANAEYGVDYGGQYAENEVDEFMFECVKAV